MLLSASALLLQAAPSGGSLIGSFLPLILIVVVFYFFLIRPQSKKQNEIKKFRASLAVGSKVVTAGGVYGVIKELTDDYVMLEVSQGVKVKVDLNSVYPSVDSSVAPAK